MFASRHKLIRRVVVAVLVLVPVAFWGSFELMAQLRERTRRGYCRSQLGVLGCTLHVYAMDYGGAFPPTFGHLYPQYANDTVIFLCDSAGKATSLVADGPHFSEEDYTPAMFGDTHSDYVYVSGLEPEDPAGYVVAFEDEWNHDGDGVHVAFVGGSVDWIQDLEWLHRQLARQEKELADKGRKMEVLRPAWSSWPDPRASGHPMAGHGPWYARRRGRILAVGAFGALAVSLALVVRTVRRRRKQGSSGEGTLNDEKE